MKRVIFSMVVATVCFVSACAEKPLTERQATLATELETAPAGSIVLYNENNLEKWGVICPERHESGAIGIATISYSSVVTCNGYAYDHADEWARRIAAIITPDEPEYEGKIEEIVMEMLIGAQ